MNSLATFLKLLATVGMCLLSACSMYNQSTLVRDGTGVDFDATQISEYRANQETVLEELKLLAGVETMKEGDKEAWGKFIRAGINYADRQCEQYLHALFRLDRDKKTAVSQIGLLGTAAAGTLGVVEAAAKEIALTAIGFGLLGSTVDNLSGNLLYELEPSAVRSLVRGLQNQYKQGVVAGYDNQVVAFSVIQGYISICLPANIEAEVNSAVQLSEAHGSEGSAVRDQPPSVSVDPRLVQTFEFKEDDNTALLENFVFPSGEVNEENLQALRDWLRLKKIEASVPTFTSAGEFELQRAEAVKFFKLSQ
jgi:hypothetical protein